MCYVCLKDDMFGMAEAFGNKYGGGFSTPDGKLRAKAIFIKQAIRTIDEEGGEGVRCPDGVDVVDRLKQAQYDIARQL